MGSRRRPALEDTYRADACRRQTGRPRVPRSGRAEEGRCERRKSVRRGQARYRFHDEEEEAVGLAEVVPFLLEDVLKQQGAKFSKVAPFKPHVVHDDLLITGQNPASSEPAADALLKVLTRETASADA